MKDDTVETNAPTWPRDFRSDRQLGAVVAILERRVGLPVERVIREDHMAMSSFLVWLVAHADHSPPAPAYAWLHARLGDTITGMLFELLAAMRTGAAAIDGWIERYRVG